MADQQGPKVEIETLSDDDLESASGGVESVPTINNTGTGTCKENSGSGTC